MKNYKWAIVTSKSIKYVLGNWSVVEPQVKGKKGVLFKKFKEIEDARAWAKKKKNELAVKRINKKHGFSKGRWMQSNINTPHWNR